MSEADLDPRWWLAKEGVMADRIWLVVRALDEALESTKLRMIRAARLYDPTIEIMGTTMDMIPFGDPSYVRGPVTMNVVKSAIDTVTSMVAKNQPRAAFLTDGASYSEYMNAQDLERFVEAEFQRSDVYDDAVRMFLDAATMGTGFIKVWANEGDDEPCIDRVYPWDIVVDEAEHQSGGIRQLHHLRFIDRDILKAMYPDKAKKIDEAAPVQELRLLNRYRQFDPHLIPVIQSWHIPSGPEEDDGVEVMSMEGVILGKKEWPYPYFPLVTYRWSERLTSYFGASLAEELAGIQNKINKINWHITRCHDLANSYVLVQPSDHKLSVKRGTGRDPLQLLIYNGMKPDFIVPQAVPRELYEHLVYLQAQAYKIAGVSEMSAASQVPKQLESGLAIQNYSDQETQRFSIQAQRYERSILDVARHLVRLMHRIGGKGTEARWKSGNLYKTIKWSDIDIDEDKYVMSIEASSLQSRTPSGRIQAAVELGRMKLLEPEQIRKLIGHPDIDRTLSLANALEDHAESICEKLSKGQDVVAEAADNPEGVLQHVLASFWIMRDRGAPDNILDCYRRFMASAVREINKPKPASAMTPPGMPPGPVPMAPGQPGPPPMAGPPPQAPGPMPAGAGASLPEVMR